LDVFQTLHNVEVTWGWHIGAGLVPALEGDGRERGQKKAPHLAMQGVGVTLVVTRCNKDRHKAYPYVFWM